MLTNQANLPNFTSEPSLFDGPKPGCVPRNLRSSTLIPLYFNLKTREGICPSGIIAQRPCSKISIHSHTFMYTCKISTFSAVCSPIAFLANSWLALPLEDSGSRDFFCGLLIQVTSSPSGLSSFSSFNPGSIHHGLCVHECHGLQHYFPRLLHPLPRLRPGQGWTTRSRTGPPALLGCRVAKI